MAETLPDNYLQDPEEFLAAHHPANDAYIQSVNHIQRRLITASKLLRHKQVQILKAVFTGKNYAEVARQLGTSSQTVSKLVNSPQGNDLLQLMQYHQMLLEGANTAQRRNMLWRIAVAEEKIDPKTSIKAVAELNKMAYQEWESKNPNAGGQKQQVAVQININQQQLPRGALDG
jgi:FixJ family two-component response regulator